MDDITILNIFDEKYHPSRHHHGQNHHLSLESKSSDEAYTEDKSHYGSLKSRELVELIEQATLNKDFNDISSQYKQVYENPKGTAQKRFEIKEEQEKKLKSSAKAPFDEHTIKRILSYFQTQEKSKKKTEKQTTKKLKELSKLVKSAIKKEKYQRPKNIDDYSQVYIILNPQPTHNSKKKNIITDIISKLSSLSSASSRKERAEVRKDRRYKGFLVKEGMFSRRARRDSKEKYDPRDSMEDYKQKRARNDHGGGRTAIPYIRHRGDIYERDN